MTQAPDFSIVISCHFEENSIEEFHGRLSATLEAMGRPYEIIMVNDGSTDSTWQKLNLLFDNDPHITVILDLFKNAGQQAAVTAAMTEARGRAWVLMDSDLQLDPGELPLLAAAYDKGADLVSGYRKNRRDSLWRILPSKLANMIMRRASDSTLRDFGCTFKIYNADLLRAFEFGPYHVFNNVMPSPEPCTVPITGPVYGRSGGPSGSMVLQHGQPGRCRRPFQVLAGFLSRRHPCASAHLLFSRRHRG